MLLDAPSPPLHTLRHAQPTVPQETQVTTWDRPDIGDSGAATGASAVADDGGQDAVSEAQDEDMGRSGGASGAKAHGPAVARLRNEAAAGGALNTSPQIMRTPLTTPAAEGVLPEDSDGAGAGDGDGGGMLPSFGDRDAHGSAADHRPHMERTESQRSTVDEQARQQALEEARRRAEEERARLVDSISAPDAVIDPGVALWAQRLLDTGAAAGQAGASGDGAQEGGMDGEDGAAVQPPLSTPRDIAEKLAGGYVGGSHPFDVAFGWLKQVHLAETERRRPADMLDACGECAWQLTSLVWCHVVRGCGIADASCVLTVCVGARPPSCASRPGGGGGQGGCGRVG